MNYQKNVVGIYDDFYFILLQAKFRQIPVAIWGWCCSYEIFFRKTEFVKQTENELGRLLLLFHSTMYEENLFVKALILQPLKDVMAEVVNIVNRIVTRSALLHRRFKAI